MARGAFEYPLVAYRAARSPLRQAQEQHRRLEALDEHRQRQQAADEERHSEAREPQRRLEVVEWRNRWLSAGMLGAALAFLVAVGLMAARSLPFSR